MRAVVYSHPSFLTLDRTPDMVGEIELTKEEYDRLQDFIELHAYWQKVLEQKLYIGVRDE